MVRLAVKEDRTLQYIADQFETSTTAVRYHLLKRNATRMQRLQRLDRHVRRFACGQGCVLTIPMEGIANLPRCPCHQQPFVQTFTTKDREGR